MHTQVLVSCGSIASGSTRNGLTLNELVFDQVPNGWYERFFSYYLSKRREQRQRRTFGDFIPEKFESGDVTVTASATSVCDCTLDYEPVELSNDHYPNVLPAVTCHGGQWCKKFVYPVLVLTNKTDDAATGKTTSYTQEGLPKEFVIQNWRFVRINVTVACTCPN